MGEILGEGGAGRVYLAFDRNLKRNVAVKESLASVPDTEMELLKELEHPGLPKVYDYFEEQGSTWLVMEYIEGMTLRKYLQKHDRVKTEQAVKWALSLCEILAYLHSRHPAVVYRDLKPENIMIKQNGTLKLIDLGGAIHTACGSGHEELCTGTPGYAPEEQFSGMQAKVSWDLYSFGVVLHEMLTGADPRKPPYERRPLSEYDRSLPLYLDQIIRRCTGEGKKARYLSAVELRSDLEACLKKRMFPGMWHLIRSLFTAAPAFLAVLHTVFPLWKGVPREQIPFPYLEKPLFYLMVTFIFYLFCFRIGSKRRYGIKQEKNIWLTAKQFPGLFLIVVLIGAAAFPQAMLFRETPFEIGGLPVYAGEKKEDLWVEMRDEQGRKLLLRDDAVYITNECVRLELPAEALPKEQVSLRLTAVGASGEIYHSRIFQIRAEKPE